MGDKDLSVQAEDIMKEARRCIVAYVVIGNRFSASEMDILGLCYPNAWQGDWRSTSSRRP